MLAPGFAKCILGAVYLRSNLSRKSAGKGEEEGTGKGEEEEGAGKVKKEELARVKKNMAKLQRQLSD